MQRRREERRMRGSRKNNILKRSCCRLRLWRQRRDKSSVLKTFFRWQLSAEMKVLQASEPSSMQRLPRHLILQKLASSPSKQQQMGQRLRLNRRSSAGLGWKQLYMKLLPKCDCLWQYLSLKWQSCWSWAAVSLREGSWAGVNWANASAQYMPMSALMAASLQAQKQLEYPVHPPLTSSAFSRISSRPAVITSMYSLPTPLYLFLRPFLTNLSIHATPNVELGTAAKNELSIFASSRNSASDCKRCIAHSY